ncbi:S100 calcium binding protein A10 (calpactin), isoform CRA_c [Mus musculus]|nr:S100 calcium binding protein A10 (calpactin), isoform CRA_c [Mus musculus]
MPSQMEHAMETMMLTFHRFAGDKDHLTKEDLRVLMEREFPGFLEVSAESLRTRYKNQSALPFLLSLPCRVTTWACFTSIYLVDSTYCVLIYHRGSKVEKIPPLASKNSQSAGENTTPIGTS